MCACTHPHMSSSPPLLTKAHTTLSFFLFLSFTCLPSSPLSIPFLLAFSQEIRRHVCVYIWESVHGYKYFSRFFMHILCTRVQIFLGFIYSFFFFTACQAHALCISACEFMRVHLRVCINLGDSCTLHLFELAELSGVSCADVKQRWLVCRPPKH